MSSSQGQATWRARGGNSHASAGHQVHPPAPIQQPPPPPPSSAAAAGPFPPGYPNAPPIQLPPGINQQQWNQGYWRFDPKPGWTSASGQVAPGHVAYNPSLVNNNRGQQQPPPPAWMPHPHWQFPADFNPYKRVPRPPDPSYWATDLLDNPLGLENMHITNDSVEGRHDHTSRTPWVWISTSLPDEGSPSGGAADAQDNKDTRPRHRFTSASEQAESRKSLDRRSSPNRKDEGSLRHTGAPLSHSRSQGDFRKDHSQVHQPPTYAPSIPKQDKSTPPRSSAAPQHHTPLSRRHTDDYQMPPSSSSSSKREVDIRTTPVNDDRSRPDMRTCSESSSDGQADDNAEEAFSSTQKELHPTFSPAIVRTPKYYSERATTPVSTPTRPSSHASTRRSSESPMQSSQSRYTAPPLVTHLDENRSDVLSPLIGATPRPSSTAIPGERIYKASASSSPPADSGSSTPPYSQSKTPVSHSHQRSKTLSRSNTYPTLDPVSEDPFSQTPRDVQSARNLPLSASRKSERESTSTTHGRGLHRSDSYRDPVLTSEMGRSRSPSRDTTLLRPSSRAPSRPQSPPGNYTRIAIPSGPSSRASSRPETPPSVYNRNPTPSKSSSKAPTRSESPLGGYSRSNTTPSKPSSKAATKPETPLGGYGRSTTTSSRPSSRAPARPESPPTGYSRNTTPSRPSSRAPSRPQTPASDNNLPPPLPPDVLARMQEKHPNAVPTPFTVRKGYWNRRGDHLTEGGKVVYAPQDRASPRDLAHYPLHDFMNADGDRVTFTMQEELLASLPRYGKPPQQPYDSFVQYERRWRPVDPITPP